MFILLVIFLVIDSLAALFLFKQAFIERSNMNRKYRTRFLLLIAVVIASIWLQASNLSLACLVAGLPATLMSLFVLGLAIAAMTHKGPWN